MRKVGIINPEVIKWISKVGHTDMILIADAGLPIPVNIPLIDLSFIEGQVPFMLVLKEILKELLVENVIIAEETEKNSKELFYEIEEEIKGYKKIICNHEELKNISENVKVIIRTGEFTPYANIILQAGVPF